MVLVELRRWFFLVFVLRLTESVNREEYLGSLGNFEIVYPKIVSYGGQWAREKRSFRETREDAEKVVSVLLKNWTLETRRNEQLIVPLNFSALWIGSENFSVYSKDSDNFSETCRTLQGTIRGEDSTVALTICEDEFYGLVHIKNRSFFIEPLKNNQHVLYEWKKSAKLEDYYHAISGTIKESINANEKEMSETDVTTLFEKSERPNTKGKKLLKNYGVKNELLDFINNNLNDELLVTDDLFMECVYDVETFNFLNMSIDLLQNVLELKATGDPGKMLNQIRDCVEHIIDLYRGNKFSVLEREESPEEVEDLDSILTNGFSKTNKLKEGHFYEGNERSKRNSMFLDSKEFYNLTGDTIDVIGDDEEILGDVEMETDEKLSIEDSEHVGYFFDRTWEKDKLPKRKSEDKEAPPRWLELAIAADHSVVEFHGSRVQRYILALLNIVSAIYKDPSLDSNMNLVIVRMVFYSEKEDGMVRSGNARKSLENVNKWNRRLLSSIEGKHDVAVWLTRLDIGGPSGYAPVSGACDPARSCALNRDEGLTSAFIIAHEVAHILGLTHDGDESAGNTCGEEATLGSVMAPMVAATFHRFHWSPCSKREFHQRTKKWSCLSNQPNVSNATHLAATLEETFTMDEQCRMEFGEGYTLCRSFNLPDPCSHLWCSRINASQICKTKKGPPLEGTTCGDDKWCINGFCEPVDRKRFGMGPIVHNSRNGGWSDWSPWGKCSRSCDIGVQFRTRKCNNPAPAYGGSPCEGKNEEFKVCEQDRCPVPVDLRSLQCSHLVSLMSIGISSPKYNNTWLPHEPDQENLKCQLSCRSKETGEIFFTGENMPDGIPCDYGSSNICVQGTCLSMGCDNVINSTKERDSCGVCDGDNSSCKNVIHKFQRKLRRAMTRAGIVPRASYNIRVDVTIVQVPTKFRDDLTIAVRDGRRRRYDVKGYDSKGRGQVLVVEGAAFRPQKLGDTYTMFARGPLFAEIVVSLAVPEEAVREGVVISVLSRHTINVNDTDSVSKYSWTVGGWSPCSASCGGGHRQKTIACIEEATGRIVPRRKCALTSKPVLHVERCNSFSCDFKWLVGPWEGCSRTCGSFGVQHRQVYCVHSSFNGSAITRGKEIEVYKMMVPPDRCTKRRPNIERECNKIPCQGRWVFSDWSRCSQGCGWGVQSRMPRCVPEEGTEEEDSLFTCTGSFIPDELRTCKGHRKKFQNCTTTCRQDKSAFCVLQILDRYCEIPGFRKKCCHSC
ncbi:A disintegrin and metalloproteinase with thrombospondin motifs 3 [Orussus abietinus]|uniref:A disintegrin and metalloproteinase with thrombospondin motifs 3 n=1 Tax=Orussus abietinus TaxID=222816 RepID=UPI0006255997|nr:A disintegrin and metalloproteinase with thrombospondin motifs 3 [Orussus abietinus]